MCVSPNSIQVSNKYSLQKKVYSVPCGYCFECVRKRKLDWEIRLSVESSVSAHTFFGMLTYNDMFYHVDVDRNEIAYYIKRLRYNLDKFYPGATLKYFLVSELGELKDRLHYHVLYFVSKEFTDSCLEFQELCKMSWVCKVPLSEDDIFLRKRAFKNFRKSHKGIDKTSEQYLDMFRWSRRKYDDVSLGFATAQMLKGGTAVGSIHYACKYIQKQYNKMFYSHLGYRPWLNYMIDSGKFILNMFDHSNLVPLSGSSICSTQCVDYPCFPVRGKLYPVPRSWCRNALGKGYTQFLTGRLAAKLSDTEKFINFDRLERFWYDEPERLKTIKQKESAKAFECAFAFEETQCFLSSIQTDIELWQMSTTLKP